MVLISLWRSFKVWSTFSVVFYLNLMTKKGLNQKGEGLWSSGISAEG